MRKRLVVAGATALVLIPFGALVGLSRREPALVIVDAATTLRPASVRGAMTDHVMVISIDGLRPDAIERFGAVVLDRLAQEGATAPRAFTVRPSVTLPSHISMLTGVPPEVHGITWNRDSTAVRGTVEVPTVFEIAKQAGFTTAVFFSKAKLKHLLKPGTLDYASGPSGRSERYAEATVEAATHHIRSHRPNLVFVHILEPDHAGHRAGWMSPAYGRAVRSADTAVGELLAAAEASYGRGGFTVIVTADHGGHDRGHRSGGATDLQIPWIAWGAGVRPSTIPWSVNTTDTAATVLWLLGVDRPVEWTGRPVRAAYTAAAQHVALDAHGGQQPQGASMPGAAP